MKKSLSSLEMHCLLEELGILADGKVEQIYQFGKRDFVFQFYLRNTGKRLLKISLPSLICLTDKKDAAEKNYGFCAFLRKRLSNSILESISQKGFERIIELHFQSKEELILIIELFSKGNIILCRKDYEIIMPLEAQVWKSREIRQGLLYKFPEARINFLKIGEDELAELLNKTDKEKIVTFLAIELGLGGIYAEELCLNSGIDKNKKPSGLESMEIKNLFKEIKALKSRKLSPGVVYKNEDIIDILPFELNCYKGCRFVKTESYSEALNKFLPSLSIKKSRYEQEIAKLTEITGQQKRHIEELKRDIVENDEKARLIYDNYTLIKNIIAELNEISRKHPWQEINERLKNHKIIKEVNPGDKTIVVAFD